MERFTGVTKWERRCLLVGAVLVVSGALHALAWLVVGGAWDGPVSLRKAVTFGLAFGLTVVTVTWLSGLLGMAERPRRAVVTVFTTACVVEVGLVTMQAWRGVPSHFDRDTAFDSAVSTVLAAGGAVIVVCALVLARAVVRMPASVPALLRVAIRWGFGGFLLALGAGVAMIVRGVTLGDTGGTAAAYAGAGAFKPVHATTMHAILVLPVIAWLLLRGPYAERARRRLLGAAVAGYALTTVVVLVDTVLGVDPFTATTLAVVAMVVGALVTVAVGVVALAGAVGAARAARATTPPPAVQPRTPISG